MSEDWKELATEVLTLASTAMAQAARIAELEAELAQYRAEQDTTPADAEWLDAIASCQPATVEVVRQIGSLWAYGDWIKWPSRGQVLTLCRVLGVGW